MPHYHYSTLIYFMCWAPKPLKPFASTIIISHFYFYLPLCGQMGRKLNPSPEKPTSHLTSRWLVVDPHQQQTKLQWPCWPLRLPHLLSTIQQQEVPVTNGRNKNKPWLRKEGAISVGKGCSHFFAHGFSLRKMGGVFCCGKTETFTAWIVHNSSWRSEYRWIMHNLTFPSVSLVFSLCKPRHKTQAPHNKVNIFFIVNSIGPCVVFPWK